MNTRLRIYLLLTGLAALTLLGLGVRLEIQGMREMVSGVFDSGLARLFFGLVLIGAAGAISIFGWRHAEREHDLNVRSERYPEQKWRWRKSWDSTTFRDRSGHPGLITVLTVLVLLPTVGAGWRFFYGDGYQDSSLDLLFGGVLVLLLVLIVVSMVMQLRWARFGELVLDLSSLPAIPGEDLSGSVISGIAPHQFESCGAEIALLCRRKFQHHVRHSHSTREMVLFRTSASTAPQFGGRDGDEGRIVFPFSVDVPVDAIASTPGYSGEVVEWLLTVTLRVGRATTRAAFNIPVFDLFDAEASGTMRSNGSIDRQHRDLAQAGSGSLGYASDGSSVVSGPAGIAATTRAGTTEITIEPTRHTIFAAATSGFALAWSAVVVYLAVQSAPVLLTILAGLFTVVPIYGTLCVWLERTRLVASRDGLTIHRDIGPFHYRRVIPADAVSGLFLSSFASVGSTNFFDLILLTNRGRRIVVAGRQPGQSVAEWIGFQVNAALGRCSRVAFSGTVVGWRQGLPVPNGPDREPVRSTRTRGATIDNISG